MQLSSDNPLIQMMIDGVLGAVLAYLQYWPLTLAILLLLALALFMKSSAFKGYEGEAMTRASFARRLPKDQYIVLNDLTLPFDGGTTQIDHVVLSLFGVFVIETKNMKGWIFGSEDQRRWTQKIYRATQTFQNPLFQNRKHIRAIAEIAGLDEERLTSVVVFVGSAQFRTPMPENVVQGAKNAAAFIRRATIPVLTAEEVDELHTRLLENRLAPSLKTNRAHKQYVRERRGSRRH